MKSPRFPDAKCDPLCRQAMALTAKMASGILPDGGGDFIRIGKIMRNSGKPPGFDQV
jgi:hypothetical protein